MISTGEYEINSLKTFFVMSHDHCMHQLTDTKEKRIQITDHYKRIVKRILKLAQHSEAVEICDMVKNILSEQPNGK
jgi:hypothetical protein